MAKNRNFLLPICCFLILALPIGFVSEQFEVSLIETAFASPNTIYVPDNSTTIKGAVDMASPNDMIIVRPGFYPETNVTIRKTVKLISETPLGAVIDGGGESFPIVNVATSYVEISGFVIQNGSQLLPYEYGAVQVRNSIGVSIHCNVLTTSYYGLWLSNSTSCNVLDNTINDNYARGIKLSEKSCNNKIIGNTIKNNPIGVVIMDATSQSNVFYHNNFVLNLGHEQDFALNTIWDNGAEGNYWSSFSGPDADGDGIIDWSYNGVGMTDYFPLVEAWSYVRFYDAFGQKVSTYSNTTVASFDFSQSEKEIGFNVTGPAGRTGFVNVSIPVSLLWVGAGENWTVCIDWVPLVPSVYTVSWNDSYTFVYVPYGLTSHRIQIFGTQAVPEFPGIVVPLFMVAAFSVAVLVSKTRRVVKR